MLEESASPEIIQHTDNIIIPLVRMGCSAVISQ
jgi:hypothetical protein